MRIRVLHIAVLSINLNCISIRNKKESGYIEGRENILESIIIGPLVIIFGRCGSFTYMTEA